MTEQNAPEPKTAYVSFSAEINVKTTESLLATAVNIVQQGFERIYLMLSTPGGSVIHGMNIYNVLLGLPIQIVTHNAGNVDSIGNMIFQAGNGRYACPHSTFMFHGVARLVNEPRTLEEKYLKEALENIRADQKRIGSVLLERTDLTEDAVQRMFLESHTMDAAEAAKLRVVDEVRDIKIPGGAAVVSLVFNR